MAMASCSVITLGLFFNKRWIFIASAAICGMVSSFTPTSRRFLGMPHLALSSLIFSTPVRAVASASVLLSHPHASATSA